MKERPRICSYQTNRGSPRHSCLANGRLGFIWRGSMRLEAPHHERQISKAHEGRRMAREPRAFFPNPLRLRDPLERQSCRNAAQYQCGKAREHSAAPKSQGKGRSGHVPQKGTDFPSGPPERQTVRGSFRRRPERLGERPSSFQEIHNISHRSHSNPQRFDALRREAPARVALDPLTAAGRMPENQRECGGVQKKAGLH